MIRCDAGGGCTSMSMYEGMDVLAGYSDIGGDYILNRFHRALHSCRDMTDIGPRHVQRAKEVLCFRPVLNPNLNLTGKISAAFFLS